jgi:hypothetical protein
MKRAPDVLDETRPGSGTEATTQPRPIPFEKQRMLSPRGLIHERKLHAKPVAYRLDCAHAFEPYPFSLLGVIVALEAVVLSRFILMRQNRMMRRGERRDHLNLQVDLLAEKEITKLLQMVRAICGQMGLQNIMQTKESAILARTPRLSL